MTIAYWCVLAAALMPLIWTGAAKTSKPGYNNKRPREFLASLEGYGARANAAQLNSFEAFPLFAAGVIIAHQIGVMDQTLIDTLAMAFISLRLLFGILYLVNWHWLRSLAWTAAASCCIAFFVLSA
ncbi:MAPEG family protein [Sansalvadorimonas sp. 2012CJ34-2]|uniref:MAPEG family protein n=1 Tax=Parendozoicomonas callyspongiae TaxID=2942213 RepID=A0ABT0PLF3_9GAMM|nr:MAPEG family protein [Sansalvadorimonas sp. 2012CJ34-2]MCL6272204.1 MAPEG family protein [Sansalvadorimonas sp. 2012CJ34-2]